MQFVIETFSLTKVFSDWWGRDRVYAVNDLNLKIHNNEVFGLLGPNGSGKTTTIKLLLGLLHPTKGHALVLGGNATSSKISARIGFLPEESYLYKYLNARETLDFYGRLFDLPAKVRQMRIEALLDMVGLKAVANRPVGTYSKGMARRIGLAQALINDPDLLILDEPTTGLDPMGTRQIKDLIKQLAKRGKTILLCSHLLADVEDVCDKIAILYGGRIQKQGKVKELLEQTNKTQITTDNISDTAIQQIRQIIQNENVDFAVTSPMDRLETFFVKTVTAAKRSGVPTSGVASDSEAKLSEFLTAQPDDQAQREAIIDKLVSQEETPQEPVALASATNPPKVIEDSNKNTDQQLLDDLSKQNEIPKPKPLTKPSYTKPIEPEEVKKNVLDELVSDSSTQDTDDKQPDSQQGDNKNA